MKKKIVYLTLIGCIFITMIGLTYAYFSLNVSGNDYASKVDVDLAQLSLIYDDSVTITGTDIEPGWTEEKTITVTNNGNTGVAYKIGWQNILNELTNNELFIEGECVSDSDDGTCDAIALQNIPTYSTEQTAETNSLVYALKDGIYIDVGETHTYTIKVYFIDTGEDQNYNQNKNFNGKLGIALSSATTTVTLGIYNSDDEQITTNISGTINSTPITGTLTDGNLVFNNVPVGDHTLNLTVNGKTYSKYIAVGISSTPDVSEVEDELRTRINSTTNGVHIKANISDEEISSIEVSPHYVLTFTATTTDEFYVATVSNTNYIIYEDEDNTIIFEGTEVKLNDDVISSATVIGEYTGYSTQGWIIDGDTSNIYTGTTYNVTEDIEIEYYVYYGCVAEGSKISMADGTYKNVEDIKSNDMILAYDIYEGEIAPQKVMYVVPGEAVANIFTVTLENGNTLQIVDYENLFDTDTKEYFPIKNSTYQSAIGRNVMVNDNGNIGISKIVSITKEVKNIKHYSLYTAGSGNYVVNNMVALSPIYFTNTRYTINDDFKVDIDKYNEDVNKYGVFTYEEMKDVCTKDTFDTFHIKDYKFVVEQGYISYDEFKYFLKLFQDEIDYYSN